MNWNPAGFALEELIGTGGSGTVWRAREISTGQPVALKRIVGPGPRALAAARSEAALLANLTHPNLIRLRRVLLAEDEVVLVLDLAEGGSLASALRRRHRLSAGETVAALTPIAAALAYAHTESIVHGDVSPANVLFTSAGVPLLSDLGVARIAGDQRTAHTTAAYVDPAVATGSPPNAASDVFMLAGVALHALNGAAVWRPVAGPDEDRADVGRGGASLVGDLSELPGRLAELPPALADVLERALAVSPSERCSAAEFALDLSRAVPAVPIDLQAGRGVGPGLTGGGPGAVVGGGADVGMASAPANGPRHAQPIGAAARANRSRADFERPELLVTAPKPGPAGSPSPALGVQPVPRTSTRAILTADPGRRPFSALAAPAARMTAMIALISLIVLGGAMWVAHSGPAHSSSAAAPAATAGSSPPVSRSSTSPAGASGPSVLTAASALTELTRLADLREQAFAHDAATLLSQVYPAGPLLTQDAALLHRVVPPGCGLVGVHTSYSSVRVTSATPGHAVVLARATLAPSQLVCTDRSPAAASGQGPTALRIELAATGGTYRVLSQQPV
jgi:hypothetical protein